MIHKHLERSWATESAQPSSVLHLGPGFGPAYAPSLLFYPGPRVRVESRWELEVTSPRLAPALGPAGGAEVQVSAGSSAPPSDKTVRRLGISVSFLPSVLRGDLGNREMAGMNQRVSSGVKNTHTHTQCGPPEGLSSNRGGKLSSVSHWLCIFSSLQKHIYD